MWKKIAETLTLLGAIVLLVPLPPSDPSPIAFMPIGAFSTALFLASRLLRHGSRELPAVSFAGLEALLFFIAAYLVNESANILLATRS